MHCLKPQHLNQIKYPEFYFAQEGAWWHVPFRGDPPKKVCSRLVSAAYRQRKLTGKIFRCETKVAGILVTRINPDDDYLHPKFFSKIKYPFFYDAEIGDTCLMRFDGQDPKAFRRNLTFAASAHKKRHKKRFSLITKNIGVRVTRIE
jgi:hypothetical protein